MVQPELTQEEYNQLQISYEAFCLDEQLNTGVKSRETDAINGFIVSESESDDASEICSINTPFDGSTKKPIEKKRKSIKLKAYRLKAKRMADTTF